MESSDHPANSNESDSFFAVGAIADTSPESNLPEEEEILNVGYNPLYLVIALYFVVPLFLALCAISTTSFVGIIFLTTITIHLLLLNRINNSYTAISAFLYFEISISVLLLIIGIVAYPHPDISINSQIVGTSFYTIMTTDSAFAIASCVLSLLTIALTITILGHTLVSDFTRQRVKFFENPILLYVVDIFQSFSLASILCTNTSYLSYFLIVYYVYYNIYLAMKGYENLPKVVIFIIEIYIILYSYYEFFMLSFPGQYWNAAGPLNYEFIGPNSARKLNVLASTFLTYLAMLIITATDWKSNELITVPTFIMRFTKYLVFVLLFWVLIYSMFFPNYCTIMWMLIVFICSFLDYVVISKLFYPYLTIIYSITFIIIAITQFSVIPHPNDDGMDQPFLFMKLFGLFKYVESTNDSFAFNGIGFYLLAYIGQLGRILHSNVITFHNMHRFDKMVDTSETAVQNQIAAASRLLFWSSQVKTVKKFFRSIFDLIYRFFIFVSLPVCCVISISAGFLMNGYLFQVFSIITMLIAILFIYKRFMFRFLQFYCALAILICAFYKSSDSYQCRGQSNCLFAGYFNLLDETGFAPPLEKSLPRYVYPFLIVFFVCIFINYEERCLYVYYSSFVIFVLYLIIALCDILYFFLCRFSLFSVFYLILGCLLIATLVMHWNQVRIFVVLLSFISMSIQFAFYGLAHHSPVRNFMNSHIFSSFVQVSDVNTPSNDIILLSLNFIFCSIAFYSYGSHDFNFQIANYLLCEINLLLNYFYFYISWILMLGFSMANSYPTLIKFFILLMFAFGSLSAKFFNDFRHIFLIEYTVFFVVQCCLQLFVTKNDISSTLYHILKYIGLYITKEDDPTMEDVKSCSIWQFSFILLSIFNFRNVRKNDDINSVFQKILNALYSMLHSFLPVIVQIAMCVSSVYNKTIFAWIFFVFLICSICFANFFNRAIAFVTGILNVCFLVQYLLYLGYPENIFKIDHWSVFDSYKEPRLSEIQKMFEFLGIYRVTPNSLIMNFISAIACTLFLQYKPMVINYKQRYNELPDFIKGMVNFFVFHVFDITLMLILCVSSLFTSIDGLLFSFITSFLVLMTSLYDFHSQLALQLVTAFILVNIGLKVFSRLPFFVAIGISSNIGKALDLPFDGNCKCAALWVIIFTLLQIGQRIIKSHLYQKVQQDNTKRLAYRFIRERQLAIIEKLDQDILLKSKSDDVIELDQSTPLNITIIEQEQPEIHLKWYQKIYQIIVEPFLVKVIKFLAVSISINDECGVNVLTLESLMLLMKRCIAHKTDFHLEERERQFLLSLPPSFSLQFSSISHILESPPIIDTNELLHRYILMCIRQSPVFLLIFVSMIYLFEKPFIFSLLIFGYIVFFFLSLDVKGYANSYRAYLIIVLYILFSRAVSRIDVIAFQLQPIGEMINNENRVSTLSLIGLDPNSSTVIEILLFITSMLFIIYQKKSMHLFAPNYYYEKFTQTLPGFPLEYCYGIIDDPVRNLVMNIPQNRSVHESAKIAMNRKSIKLITHYSMILIFDLISLIFLIAWWPNWESDDKYSQSTLQRVNVIYVFILFLQVIFLLVVYHFCLANSFTSVYIVNFIWYIYEFSVLFFYIPNQFTNTFQFYLFLRIMHHLITAHKCFFGRIEAAYQFPQFQTDRNHILFYNLFLKYFPFAFEIRTILLWIGRPTYLTLSDFFIIKDMEIQLEILICKQIDHKIDRPEQNLKKRMRIMVGLFFIVVFIAIIIIPLLFFMTSSNGQSYNPVIQANLEIGVGTFPPFYEANGFITPITSDQHLEMINGNMNEIVSQFDNTLFVVHFPSYSTSPYRISKSLVNNMVPLLEKADSAFSMYIKLQFSFQYPTTVVRDIISDFVTVSSNFDSDKKEQLLSIVLNQNRTIQADVKLPRVVLAHTSTLLESMNEYSSSFMLINDNNAYQIQLIDDNHQIQFMKNSSDIMIVVYSQPVSSKTMYETNKNANENIIGIYLVLLIIFGIVLREFVMSQAGNIWRKKMDNPMKLYKLVALINMYKNAGDIQHEKEISDQFLDQLREQEKFIDLTGKED